MIPLIRLMILLGNSSSSGVGPTPRLPDAEYIDVGIFPELSVTRVHYKDFVYDENLAVGINNISLTVTHTGVNPI